MGGMVAQELVLRHPEKVRHAHPREHLRRWRRDDPARSRGPDRPVRGADVRRRGARGPLRLRALQRAGGCEIPGNFESFVALGKIFPTPFETLLTQLGAVDGYTTAERLPSVTVPTVIVHGTIDRSCPSPTRRRSRRDPRCRAHRVRGGRAPAAPRDGARVAEAINGVSARRDNRQRLGLIAPGARGCAEPAGQRRAPRPSVDIVISSPALADSPPAPAGPTPHDAPARPVPPHGLGWALFALAIGGLGIGNRRVRPMACSQRVAEGIGESVTTTGPRNQRLRARAWWSAPRFRGVRRALRGAGSSSRS